MEIYKLEILNQFKLKCPDLINPELVSILYCQTQQDAYLEMYFKNAAASPIITNLVFITDGIEVDPFLGEVPPLFNPAEDIVDNAQLMIDLDEYSLINCVDGLFTTEAAEAITDSHLNSIKKTD